MKKSIKRINKTRWEFLSSTKTLLVMFCIALCVFFSQGVSAALEDEMLMYHDFEDVEDKVDSIFNLTLNNSVVFTTTDAFIGKSGNISDDLSFFGIINSNTVFDFGDRNFSISGWTKIKKEGRAELMVKHRGGPANGWWILRRATGELTWLNDATVKQNTSVNMSLNAWTMFSITSNQTHVCLFLNGSLENCFANDTINPSNALAAVGSNFLSSVVGLVDEIGIWNKTLSIAEINSLYNSGNGLIFDGTTFGLVELSVVLDNPPNNFRTIDTSLSFNATLTPVLINLTNATINIWYPNETLFNKTTNIILGNVTNSTSWIISNLSFDTFHWNVFGCGLNASNDTLCVYANSNSTFTIQKFSVTSEVFNKNVSETDAETFEINISTISAIISVDARLIYNGTSHSATTTCDSGLCNSKATIDIPLITEAGEEQNTTFFWNITVFNSVESVSGTSDLQEQNVSRIHLEECDATYTIKTLNFKAYDEEDSSRINPFYFAGDFAFWLGSGSVKRNNSFLNLSTADIDLCILPADRNYTTNAIVEYNDVINSSTYNTRNYFFQQDIINNQSQDIPLFLLNVADSTSFILKVQDTNLLPLPDVLIVIQRFNPGTGNFTTVSIAKTDDNGQTVGFFKTETVDYRFIIKKNGVILLQTGVQKVIPETAPFTLTFTVGIDEGAPWTRFEDLPNLTKSLAFNNTDNTVAFIYTDISGEFSLSRLLVIRQNLTGDSPTVCDTNSALASGKLSCSIGNVTGTYIASAFITRGSDIFLVEQIVFKVETFSSVAGLLGVFLAWFIILISAFAFKFNEIAGIILMNLTVIFVNVIGLVNFGYLFIFGMAGVSIIIIVLLEK